MDVDVIREMTKKMMADATFNAIRARKAKGKKVPTQAKGARSSGRICLTFLLQT